MRKIVDLIRNKLSNELLMEIKDKDVAKYLGISASKLALLKTRDSIPYSNIIKLCKDRKWNLNEIFLDDVAYSNCSDTYSVRLWNSLEDNCYNNTPTKHIKIDKSIIKYLQPFGALENIEALHYFSDDMEPTIYKDTILFIDCNVNRLVNPGLFAICTPQGLSIKRLTKSFDNDSITLISDNKNYPFEQLQEDEFKIIGLITGVIEWK